MSKNIIIKIILIISMILSSVAVTIGAMCLICSNGEKTDFIPLKAPEELTKEELQQIYRKYDITENDIKFAKGELPHYLEGTILYDKKVVVLESLELLEDEVIRNAIMKLKPDYIITKEEQFIIIEKARKEYIKRFGVDPANPKVEIVNGVPLPREYVKELIKSGKLSLKGFEEENLINNNNIEGSAEGPQAINGEIYVYIVEAKDDEWGHKPDGINWLYGTYDAVDRFEDEFGVDIITMVYWNSWDLSDVSPPDDSVEALKDFVEDFGYLVNPPIDNKVVIGWTDLLDHNGIAVRNGFHSVGSENPYHPPWWPDWPDDSVAQHELSHNFNAYDQGTWCWEHPECIMNHCWAYLGTDKWCDDCWHRVFINIWGISDE